MAIKELPELHGFLKKIMHEAPILKEVPSASYTYQHMLFDTPEDEVFHKIFDDMEKYIEPLKLVIEGLPPTDTHSFKELSSLLSVISNPSRATPLQQLIGSLPLLAKIEIIAGPRPSTFPEKVVVDVFSATLKNPNAKHALQKTFKPYLELVGNLDIRAPKTCTPTGPHHKEPPQEIAQEIPHVLQSEIAQLNQKFLVSLDRWTRVNKTIQLICHLDHKRLPCVPPISVNIPEEYPFTSPTCSLSEYEYSATSFLCNVQNYLIDKIVQLPKCYSLTRLLDAWELSVRQACSTNTSTVPVNDLAAIFGM